MDRQAIERRDFPIARRGYEIEAVDAHLVRLADEYETLARRGRPDGGGLAASAAEQVRLIVEAAEQSAEDMARDAELDARRVRQEGREDAERLRTEAGREAREHVARVAEVARSLLDRVEAMERELGSMLDAVRGGSQRLTSDLSLLQSSVGEVRALSDRRALGEAPAPAAALGEAAGRPQEPVAPDQRLGAGARDTLLPEQAAGPPPPSESRAARPTADAEPAFEEQRDGEGSTEAPHPEPSVTSEPAGRPDPSLDAVVDSARAAESVLPAADGDVSEAGDDAARRAAEGARMVALNMALNGVPREETREHVAHNFSVADLDALLDEVYARVAQ